ncbi:hypothetical protein HDU97_005805 [Phlyctochytrium planicorne]|nr:hypothetical protein HDU97_005805 [Phlyctochytrium planicorne]
MALRIPIIGAGTVGQIMAIALKRAGHLPELYDGIPRAGDVGGGINFAPNGLKVLKDMGLLDGFIERGVFHLHIVACKEAIPFKLSGVSSLLDKIRSLTSFQGQPCSKLVINKLDGRPIASFSQEPFLRKYGIPNIAIRRSRLQTYFLEAAANEGIPIHFNKQLSSVSQPSLDKLGVTATFKDDTQTTGDVLIGADGLHSKTRVAVFGEEPPPKYTGIEAIIGISQADTAEAASITRIHQGAGKQFGMYGIGGDREMLWFVAYPQAEEKLVRESWEADGEGVAKREAHEISAIFRKWGLEEGFAKIVERSSRIIRYGIFEREPRDTWSKGNVVLIGDAAHPMPPHLGQGGNTALEDAAVLASLITKLYKPNASDKSNASLKTAFKIYTELRAKRTANITKAARELGKINSISSPFLCALRDSAIALAIWYNGGAPPVDAMYGYNCEEVVANALRAKGL